MIECEYERARQLQTSQLNRERSWKTTLIAAIVMLFVFCLVVLTPSSNRVPKYTERRNLCCFSWLSGRRIKKFFRRRKTSGNFRSDLEFELENYKSAMEGHQENIDVIGALIEDAKFKLVLEDLLSKYTKNRKQEKLEKYKNILDAEILENATVKRMRANFLKEIKQETSRLIKEAMDGNIKTKWENILIKKLFNMMTAESKSFAGACEALKGDDHKLLDDLADDLCDQVIQDKSIIVLQDPDVITFEVTRENGKIKVTRSRNENSLYEKLTSHFIPDNSVNIINGTVRQGLMAMIWEHKSHPQKDIEEFKQKINTMDPESIFGPDDKKLKLWLKEEQQPTICDIVNKLCEIKPENDWKKKAQMMLAVPEDIRNLLTKFETPSGTDEVLIVLIYCLIRAARNIGAPVLSEHETSAIELCVPILRLESSKDVEAGHERKLTDKECPSPPSPPLQRMSSQQIQSYFATYLGAIRYINNMKMETEKQSE